MLDLHPGEAKNTITVPHGLGWFLTAVRGLPHLQHLDYAHEQAFAFATCRKLRKAPVVVTKCISSNFGFGHPLPYDNHTNINISSMFCDDGTGGRR